MGYRKQAARVLGNARLRRQLARVRLRWCARRGPLPAVVRTAQCAGGAPASAAVPPFVPPERQAVQVANGAPAPRLSGRQIAKTLSARERDGTGAPVAEARRTPRGCVGFERRRAFYGPVAQFPSGALSRSNLDRAYVRHRDCTSS